MSRTSKNLSILFRTERLIARRRLKVLQTQTGILLFAGFIAGIGLIMLNVSGFFLLRTHMSLQAAGATIALANFLLALILLLFASRYNVEEELEPLIELRDSAIAELEGDLEQALSETKELSQSVRQIVRDPLGSVLPSLIGPILAILTSKKK